MFRLSIFGRCIYSNFSIIGFCRLFLFCGLCGLAFLGSCLLRLRLSLALVKALGQPEKHSEVLAVLTQKSERANKRRSEAKAHQRNIRKGKK